MKTTVEISDPLLREARKLAAREGVTLRIVIERGLHRVITETKQGTPFKRRRASFKIRLRNFPGPVWAVASSASWIDNPSSVLTIMRRLYSRCACRMLTRAHAARN